VVQVGDQGVSTEETFLHAEGIAVLIERFGRQPPLALVREVTPLTERLRSIVTRRASEVKGLKAQVDVDWQGVME
jgi:hypothetical protein